MSKGGLIMDNEILTPVEAPKKKKGKKKWIIISVIAVFLIIVLASSGDSKPKVETPSEQNGSSQPSQESKSDNDGETQDETKQIKVGSTVSDDELKITFKSCNANFTRYSKYADIKKGYKVMQAVFVFENISPSDAWLNGFECYADGEKCENFYSVDDYKSSVLESISPGRKVTATMYYEVPKNAKNIELEYERDAWTSEKYVFVVK